VFQRFSDNARKAIVFAQHDARDLHHDTIGSEHILLGILRDAGSVAVAALHESGADFDRVRRAVIARRPVGEPEARDRMPFEPEAKRVLERALRETLLLGDDHIGTSHLLLAMLATADDAAAQILVELGADPEQIRAAILAEVDPTRIDRPEPHRPTSSPRSGPVVGPGPAAVLAKLAEQVDRLEVEVARLAAIVDRLGRD
jgi:ATP-dependent Clp protease ATP-binding subunit ClpC